MECPHYVDFVYALVFLSIQKTRFDPFCLVPLVVLLSSNNTWTIGLSVFQTSPLLLVFVHLLLLLKLILFYCFLIFSKRCNIPFLGIFCPAVAMEKKCWNSGFFYQFTGFYRFSLSETAVVFVFVAWQPLIANKLISTKAAVAACLHTFLI